MKNTPEPEFGLDYHVYVLRRMVDQLPNDVSISMHAQIDEVVKAVADRQKQLVREILPQLEDAIVDIKYLEFDRRATADERDAAIRKIRDMQG